MEELSEQLLQVSEEGKLEELQSLLESKANVNYQDKDGWTGLIWASYKGRVQCAQLLVEHKADIDLVDQYGNTALIRASLYGRADCVKLLLESKATVDHANERGLTALMRASFFNRVDCVKLLLECKATVDHASNNGYTALMWASCINRVDCVKLLLEHRADVNHETDRGGTAMSQRGMYNGNQASKDLLGFLFLCCGAHEEQAEASDMELWAEMKTRIRAYHTELKKVLSEEVIVDTRLYLEEHGLYHEPLERVMEYCGLDLLLEDDPNRNEDDPIPMLLRDRPERVRSAWYWWNLSRMFE